MSWVPGQPPEPADQEARLADLLEACLRAERGAPGSAVEVVQGAPEELRAELTELLAVARALDQAAWAAAPPEFRAGARERFQATAQPAPAEARGGPRRVAPWIVRVAAGLAALALASYGGVVASTDSLPGQPLYAVKQADEFVTLGLTRDDLSRALVLLRQAGARLDEATRLATAGQVQTAGDLLQQYAATLRRAASTLSRASAADPQARADFQAQLQHQLDQLDAFAREAPEPLRPGIQQAHTLATQVEQGAGQAATGPGATESGTPGPDQPAPGPSPAPPAVSPSPAASPSVGGPSRAPAVPPPSPVSSSVEEAAPTPASK